MLLDQNCGCNFMLVREQGLFSSICMFFIKNSESKCACFIIISHCLSEFFLPGSVRWFVNRSRLISARAACRFCIFSGLYLAYLTLWNLLNFLIALCVHSRQFAFVDTQKRHTAVQQAQSQLRGMPFMNIG